eukprot:gene24744-30683_t
MDALFHDAPTTNRYGVGEVLYGIEAIREFRKGRGGSPQRRLGHVAITVYGTSFATVDAEFFRENSTRRGRQSQSWPGRGQPLTLEEINALDQAAFVARFGSLFEHSPWVVERAAALRPFADLHAGLMAALHAASTDEQLALIRAHPELAGKAAVDRTLTAASAAEQASAGLD